MSDLRRAEGAGTPRVIPETTIRGNVRSGRPPPVLFDPAVVQGHHAREAVNDLLVVRHHQDGRLLVLRHLAQQVHHHRSAFGIACGGRLVGKGDGKAVGERAGNRHTRRRAAREPGRHGRGTLADLKVVAQVARASAGLGGLDAGKRHGEGDSADGSQGQQRVLELGDEADPLALEPAEVGDTVGPSTAGSVLRRGVPRRWAGLTCSAAGLRAPPTRLRASKHRA